LLLAGRACWRGGGEGGGGGKGGQAYVQWLVVGDDRAGGDGRASVGRIGVVVRARGGGVVWRAGFGGCGGFVLQAGEAVAVREWKGARASASRQDVTEVPHRPEPQRSSQPAVPLALVGLK
jgi:hypothetical protein